MNLRSFFIAGLCVLCCAVRCKEGVDPAFVEYLRAEQGLRDRLSNSPALSDSLAALEERLGVNRKGELEYLKSNPEQWVVLLKALRNER